MDVKEKLKEVIQENLKALNNNDFTTLYKAAYNKDWYSGKVTTLLTELLLDAGINPLEYMTYVPDCWLYTSESVKKVTIPGNIKTVNFHAVSNNISLKELVLEDGIERIGIEAFFRNINLTKIVVPDSVTQIDKGAFMGNYSLKEIKLPSNLTTISESLCSSCQSLVTVDIPKHVRSIGTAAFWYCPSLTSITIPKSVVEISSGAFEDSALKEIIYEGTIEDWEKIELGEQSSVSHALKLICTDSEKQLRWW